jgi:hypothetical protein
MLDGKHASFPEKVLVALGCTLGKMMEPKQGGKHDN